MIVYQLDKLGYYVGEVEADESPLEPGVYLIPAGCIETPPPNIPEGKVAKWTGSEWVLEDIPNTTTETQPSPSSLNIISKVDFIKRLTPIEWHAARTSTIPEVLYFVDLVLAASSIDLEDTQTKAGLSVAVATGIISSDRVDQILSF